MIGVVVCETCGAKIRPRHHRCPRCGVKFTSSAAPRFDVNRLAPAAIGLLVVVGAVAGYAVWRPTALPVETPVAAPDRPAAARAPAAARPVTAPAERAAADIPFVEANRAGNHAYADGDFERALAAYDEATRKNPADAESWSNRGQVLVRMNRVAEALPAFERAIELNGQRWAYHFNLARAQGLLGRWDVAVAGYREAQRLLPDDYAVTFNLGLSLRQAGDVVSAAEQLEKAATLNPTDASFHFALARTYDELGRRQDALAAYQQTLVLAPDVVEAPAIRARIDALIK